MSDRPPVLQVDFAVLGAEEHREKSVTLFTPIGIRTQMAMAIFVPSKSVNLYALAEFKRFINEIGRMPSFRRMASPPSRRLPERALQRSDRHRC